MIVLKTILIFFIISPCTRDGQPVYFKQYYTQVIGIVRCRFSAEGTAIAYISENPYTASEYRLIDFKHIRYNCPFRLNGKITRTRKPELYIKIIHNCENSNNIKDKVFLKKIPSNFIKKNINRVQSYYAGIMELFTMNQRRRSSFRY